MNSILLCIICYSLFSTQFVLAVDPVSIRSEVSLEKQKSITILFQGAERIIKRMEYDTEATGKYDRIIEQFYYEEETVFTYSHFEPAAPSGMYHSSKGILVFSGSLDVHSPQEVLLIGLPTSKKFYGYVLEGGTHRPMTAAELDHIRGATKSWSQLYDGFPKPEK